MAVVVSAAAAAGRVCDSSTTSATVTRDDAGEAATNGLQTPLTAVGPAVGAVAGAAACITHHSDAVTTAHTTGQHTHAVSDATSIALTAEAPPAPAEGTAGEAAA
jgi:hypothetical protein